jgi:hypothetical protein
MPRGERGAQGSAPTGWGQGSRCRAAAERRAAPRPGSCARLGCSAGCVQHSTPRRPGVQAPARASTQPQHRRLWTAASTTLTTRPPSAAQAPGSHPTPAPAPSSPGPSSAAASPQQAAPARPTCARLRASARSAGLRALMCTCRGSPLPPGPLPRPRREMLLLRVGWVGGCGTGGWRRVREPRAAAGEGSSRAVQPARSGPCVRSRSRPPRPPPTPPACACCGGGPRARAPGAGADVVEELVARPPQPARQVEASGGVKAEVEHCAAERAAGLRGCAGVAGQAGACGSAGRGGAGSARAFGRVWGAGGEGSAGRGARRGVAHRRAAAAAAAAGAPPAWGPSCPPGSIGCPPRRC